MVEENFVNRYSEFFRHFINGTADAVEMLSEVQEAFPDDYNTIKNFGRDPQNLNELIEKLSPEHQNVLFKLLIKSGSFSRKMVSLFDLSVGEQKTFAEELRAFSEDIEKDLKTIKKR